MQDIKDRVEEAIEFLDNLPKDDIFRREIDASIRFVETVKELTEREAKLVEALKFYADGDYQEGGGVGGNKANNFEIDYGQIATKRLKELGY